MNKDIAAAALLSLSTEDRFGLYEAIAELNRLFPDETLDQKYDVAKEALAYLHQKRWIQFERVIDSTEHLLASPIDDADVPAMLSDRANWDPPLSDERITFSSTDAGFKAYMAKSET